MKIDTRKVLNCDDWCQKVFNGQSVEEFTKDCDSIESAIDLMLDATLDHYHYREKDQSDEKKEAKDGFKTYLKIIINKQIEFDEKWCETREKVVKYATERVSAEPCQVSKVDDESEHFNANKWFQDVVLDGQSVEEFTKDCGSSEEVLSLLVDVVVIKFGEVLIEKNKDAIKLLLKILSDERFRIIDERHEILRKVVKYDMDLVNAEFFAN